MVSVERVFIIEPSLLARYGHPYWLSRHMSELFRARGLECVVIGNRHLRRNGVGEYAEPFFSHTPMENLSDDPIAGPMEDFIGHGNLYARELSRLAERFDAERDALLFPTCYSPFVLGLGQWLSDHRGPLPKASALLSLPTGFDPATGQAGINAVFYRFAFNRLPNTDRLSLFGANALETNEFAQLTQRPVTQAPLAVVGHPDDPVEVPSFTEDRFTVFYPATGLRIQGRELLPDIIAACRDRGMTGVRILYQSDADLDPSQGGDGVELCRFPVGLDQSAWRGLFVAADLVMLMYDPAFFRATPSGQFGVAASLGRVILTSAGTSMAHELADSGGAGRATIRDAGSIAATIDQMRANHSRHQQAAIRFAKTFNRQNGAWRFVDQLLETWS